MAKADLFSKKQIYDAVNNALAKAMRCAPEEISPKRTGRLHKYAEALTKETSRLVDDELLRPEEAVMIHLVIALALQHRHSGHRSEQLAEVASLVRERPPEKPWIGVGLDGVLAAASEGSEIGEPLPKMLQRVKGLLENASREGHPAVKILTRRVSGVDAPEQAEKIASWCKEHLGRVVPITHEITASCLEIWDYTVRSVAWNGGDFV